MNLVGVGKGGLTVDNDHGVFGKDSGELRDRTERFDFRHDCLYVRVVRGG